MKRFHAKACRETLVGLSWLREGANVAPWIHQAARVKEAISLCLEVEDAPVSNHFIGVQRVACHGMSTFSAF